MIEVGALAPEFIGTTAEGAPFSLSSTRGRPLVLYFYPKASTAGCTREAREFTSVYDDLQREGVDVVGVSVDTVGAQKRFAENCGIPFPLIADSDKAIARMYGVLGILGVARRVTFLIDATGRVSEVVEGILPGQHVQAARSRFGIPPK
jgi:thioredoxin-dependent peroxiredoxin